MKVLLNDPRVDPAAQDDEALREASKNRHLDVVKVLLADPRVDPQQKLQYRMLFLSSQKNNSLFE